MAHIWEYPPGVEPTFCNGFLLPQSDEPPKRATIWKQPAPKAANSDPWGVVTIGSLRYTNAFPIHKSQFSSTVAQYLSEFIFTRQLSRIHTIEWRNWSSGNSMFTLQFLNDMSYYSLQAVSCLRFRCASLEKSNQKVKTITQDTCASSSIHLYKLYWYTRPLRVLFSAVLVIRGVTIWPFW